MMLMIVSSVLISFGGLLSRLFEDADPNQINFYRSLSVFFTFSLVFLYNHRGQSVQDFRKVGWSGVLASLCLTVAGIAFMQALAHTTVANTMFTLAAIPFLTAALAWAFLREHLSLLTVITMCAAALGVTLMVVDGIGLGSVFGNVMALVTALGFSAFAVIVRRALLPGLVDMDQDVEAGLFVAIDGANAGLGIIAAIGGDEVRVDRQLFEVLADPLVTVGVIGGLQRRAAVLAESVERIRHRRPPTLNSR